MTTPYLVGDIARDEGLRLKAYQDTLSNWTIGYGHTGPEVHEGVVWTLAQATARLVSDVGHAIRQLDAHIPWWRTLNDPREDVLTNCCFNMGWGGLSGFHNTLAHLEAGAFEAAAEGLLASKWASQVGARAVRLAEQMRTGVRA